MNETEKRFDNLIKSKGITYKQLSFRNKLTTAKHEFNGETIEIHQVPDFISIRGKEIDIIEIKHGFVHQDYPFRDKLLKMYVGRLNKVFNQENHDQEPWILKEFLRWMESIFSSNEKVINNIKLITNSNSFNFKLKINYFVLQPNNKNIQADNPYAPEFVDFYKHDDHLKEIVRQQKIEVRKYHRNLVDLFILCLNDDIQINEYSTMESLLNKYNLIGELNNTLINTLNSKLILKVPSQSTLINTLTKNLLITIKLRETNYIKSEHMISNHIKTLFKICDDEKLKELYLLFDIFTNGKKKQSWSTRRSSDFKVVKDDIRKLNIEFRKKVSKLK